MDPSIIDLVVKFGLPTAAAVYLFWRYDAAQEKRIGVAEERAKKAEEAVERIRGVVDKQVEAQHAMIIAQAKIIDDRRTEKAG
jgi:hypothetical protein